MSLTAGAAPDEPTLRLLAQLRSPDSNAEALYGTLLTKLRYLTDGTVLSEGGAPIMRQVKLFIENRPEMFSRDEASHIMRGVLSAPKPSITKKAASGRTGQPPDTICTLAAAALFALYRSEPHWPLDLLNYYLLDAVGPRHWVDAPGLALLTRNLLEWTKESRPTDTPSIPAPPATSPVVPVGRAEEDPTSDMEEEKEEVLEEGGADILPQEQGSGEARNRFSGCMAGAAAAVLDCIRRRLDATNNIVAEAGSGTHSMILVLAAFCGMSEVRGIAVGCLPRLLGQISAAEQVKQLVVALVEALCGPPRPPSPHSGVGSDDGDKYLKTPGLSPSDMAVATQLIKLRAEVKPSQQEMYRGAVCGLAAHSASLGRLVLRVLIEDDILLTNTSASKGDTIKLLMHILRSVEAGAAPRHSPGASTGSLAAVLLGLTVHDILASRIGERTKSGFAASGWDSSRDGMLLDIIAKVLRQLNVKRTSLLDFFRVVLLEPSQVAAALADTAGHMPSVDRVTGVRQSLFPELLLEGAQDTTHRRKALSDVLWMVSEVSKLLQVLLGHEICTNDKALRDKDRSEGKDSTDGGVAASGGRGALGRGGGGSSLRLNNGPPRFGGGMKALGGGRVGPITGVGRGGIPAGLTLNRSGSKPSRSAPSPAGRMGAPADVRAEPSRPRAGSVDSADGLDTGFIDSVVSPTQLKEQKQEFLKDVLCIQELSLRWLADVVSHVTVPSAMCCSLLPTGASAGRLPGSSGGSTATGSVESTSGVTASKETIPQGDSPCIFVTTAGGVSATTEIKDDHARLWIDWIKACMCLNVSPHHRTSIEIDRTVHILLRDSGILSTIIVDKLIFIARILTRHSYNTDVYRLRDGVDIKGKAAAATEGSANPFCSNRRRDLLLLVHTLDALDAVVIRGIKTVSDIEVDDKKRNGVLVNDVNVLYTILSLSHLSVLNKNQQLGSDAAVALAPRPLPPLPPLALKSLYWRCAVSCYLLGCACPSTLGLHLWNRVPTVKGLMLMSITSQFGDALVEAPDIAVSQPGTGIVIRADADTNILHLDPEVSTCLYMDYKLYPPSNKVPAAQNAASLPSRGSWKYTAINGVALVLNSARAVLASSCSHHELNQAVDELEKRVLATLFTEIRTDKRKEKQKEKIVETQELTPQTINGVKAPAKDADDGVAPDRMLNSEAEPEVQTRKRARGDGGSEKDRVRNSTDTPMGSTESVELQHRSISPPPKRSKEESDSGQSLPPPLIVLTAPLLGKKGDKQQPDKYGGSTSEHEHHHNTSRIVSDTNNAASLQRSPSPRPNDLKEVPDFGQGLPPSRDSSANEELQGKPGNSPPGNGQPSGTVSTSGIVSDDSSSTLGLRRSTRIRTARFDVAAVVRSGGTSRVHGTYADLSCDEEAKRRSKRGKKRKRKGLKGGMYGALSKDLKKKKVKENKSAIKKAAILARKQEKLLARKKRHMDEAIVESMPPNNMAGSAYTTQFGSIMSTQPPFMSADGLPSSCAVLIISVKDFDRDPPSDIKSLVKSLDVKYNFGTILRRSTAPDFIASAVLAGTDCEDAEGGNSNERDKTAFATPTTLREHVEHSSSWLLSTISADSRVLFRVPPVGCAHLFLIVSHKLVKRINISSIWENEICFGNDPLWALLLADNLYREELQLLLMLATRLLQVMRDPNLVEPSDSVEKAEMGPLRSSITAIFKVILWELCCASADRRCSARLAVMSLLKCSEHHHAIHSKGVDTSETDVTGGGTVNASEAQVRSILSVVADSESFAHEIIRTGPWWPDSMNAIWDLSHEVSARIDISLIPLVSSTISAMLAFESNTCVLKACIKSLSTSEESSIDVASVEKDLMNLKSQAAMEGTINLLSQQPAAALCSFEALSVDCLPNIFGDLLEDMLEGAQIDGLVKRDYGEDGSCDVGNGMKFVSIRLGTSAAGGVHGSSWVAPGPSPTLQVLGTTPVDLKVHVNIVSGLVTALSIYIINFADEFSGNLADNWRNIASAAVHLLNLTPPRLLLQVFRDSLVQLGSSITSPHSQLCEILFGWMSLEVLVALMESADRFSLCSVRILCRFTVKRLRERLNSNDVLKDAEPSTRKKMRSTKEAVNVIETELSVFVSAFSSVCGQCSSSALQFVVTACEQLLIIAREGSEDAKDLLVLLQEVAHTFHDDREVASLRYALVRFERDGIALKNTTMDTESTLLDSDIDDFVGNTKVPEQFWRTVRNFVSWGQLDEISLRINKRSVSFLKLCDFVSMVFSSSFEACLGNKMRVLDILFLNPVCFDVAEAQLLFEKLYTTIVSGEDYTTADRQAVAYLYYRIVDSVVNSQGPQQSAMMLWVSRWLFAVAETCWPVGAASCELLCTCQTGGSEVYEDLLCRVATLAASGMEAARDMTKYIWGEIATTLKKKFNNMDNIASIRVVSTILLTSYAAFPEEIYESVEDSSKPLYLNLLLSTSRYNDAGNRKVDIKTPIYPPLVCGATSRFQIRKEEILSSSYYWDLTILQLMNSSLGKRLKYATDILTLHFTMFTSKCGGHSILNSDLVDSAKALFVLVAGNHPVLWTMFVPVMLQVLYKGCGESYLFPLPACDDFLSVRERSHASQHKPSLLSLTSPPILENIPDTAFVASLKEVISVFRACSNGDVKNMLLPMYSVNSLSSLAKTVDAIDLKEGADDINPELNSGKESREHSAKSIECALENCGFAVSPVVLQLFGQ